MMIFETPFAQTIVSRCATMPRNWEDVYYSEKDPKGLCRFMKKGTEPPPALLHRMNAGAHVGHGNVRSNCCKFKAGSMTRCSAMWVRLTRMKKESMVGATREATREGRGSDESDAEVAAGGDAGGDAGGLSDRSQEERGAVPGR